MGKTAGFIRRADLLWCVGIALFVFTVIAGAQLIPPFQPDRTWVTIRAEDPPRPAADPSTPSPAAVDAR